MAHYDIEDTIAGIASAAGAALRGVVRLSGPDVVHCLDAHFETPRAELRALSKPSVARAWMKVPLPVGEVPGELYVWPTSQSYTRQPAAEFHTIGSPPVLQAVLRALCQHNVRLAEPGEFTMRAFLAGRLDLTQAEAVLGVIDADSANQLGTALRQLAGGLAAPLQSLRSQLLELLAHLEAGLDFVEEEIEFITQPELLIQLDDSIDRISRVARQLAEREGGSDLPRVVLTGAANVGKSTLFNAIAGGAVALVSDEKGTTRDYLTCQVDANGQRFELVDTAGATETPVGFVERSAQNQAQQQGREADLQLVCVDVTGASSSDVSAVRPAGESQLLVYTKCDQSSRRAQVTAAGFETSGATGRGVAALLGEIRRRLRTNTNTSSLAVPTTATRCHRSLQDSLDRLQEARLAVQNCEGEELVAAELREALDHLGQVVGAVYTDDILDLVFSRFCIGK